MLRGYRSIVAALGLILASAGLPPQQAAQPNQTASQSASKADIARNATALERLPQAENPDTGCEQGREDRKSGLCAQWNAADTAHESAVWAQRTFWLGVVGATIGLLTLGAAAFAARWAKAAANETAKGSKAASDSLDEARRVNQALVRPYVYFRATNEEALKFERGGKVPFAFKNFESTPALAVTLERASEIVTRPIGAFVVALRADKGLYGDVAPGEEVRDGLVIDIAARDIAEVAGGKVMLLRMRLTYQIPGGGSDCQDKTWFLDSTQLPHGDFGLLSDDERQRGPS